MRGNKLDHAPQQYLGVYAPELLRRVGKELAYVAQREGTEQRVAYSVYRHIAVGVCYAAFGVFHLDASQHEPQPVGQRMDVVSVSYSYIHIIVCFVVFCRVCGA